MGHYECSTCGEYFCHSIQCEEEEDRRHKMYQQERIAGLPKRLLEEKLNTNTRRIELGELESDLSRVSSAVSKRLITEQIATHKRWIASGIDDIKKIQLEIKNAKI